MAQPQPSAPASATLEDVARHAGVSRQTVSNAINAPGKLRPDTLDRVLRAIDDMGYRPNRNARSLRTKTSRLIGFRVTPATDGTAADSLFDRFLHPLVEHAQGHGYHVLLFTPPQPDDELSGYAELLGTTAVDAFVLVGTHHGDHRLAWLAERDAPFVAFGRPWEPRAHHNWVDVDGAAGTAAAVDHLVVRGHHRIAFVGWPRGSDTGDDRRAGWRRAARRHGLPVTGLSVAVDDGVDSGARAAGSLLDAPHPPTALVCASDTLAIGCLHALVARGMQPGADVAVTGFDDSAAAALVPPGLTTVRQPLEEVAREVIRLLGGLLDAGTVEAGVVLQPSLVVRGTT